MDSTLRVMVGAARFGGEQLMKYFGKTLATKQKSTAADFRTKADLASERAVLSVLRKKYPKYGIHSEEQGISNSHATKRFVIDPLDGTNNFVLGIPMFSVSIGLMDGARTTHSVVYNPLLKHMYFAALGKGAYCNGQKLKVNQETDIHRATLAYACSYTTSAVLEEKRVHQMRSLRLKRILTSWSPALDLCMLASGRIEAFASDKNELYDYVAGKLIAKEAGGFVTSLAGKLLTDDTVDTFMVCNTASNRSVLQKAFK